MSTKSKKGKKSSSASTSVWRVLFSKLCKWGKYLVLFFFASTIFVTLLYRFVPVYYTPLMFIRCMEQRSAGKEMSISSKWVPLSEINQNMVNAAVVAEDSDFMSHYGFDLNAIRNAISKNKEGGKIYGGSTISQQTAKNVFLWPSRTWVRKGLETYFTVLIELFWSKARIMEVYLNIVELGDGIYGVEAASTHYFGKPARRLSPSQSALLAASLVSPLKFDPSRPSSYLYKKEKILLKRMELVGNVDLMRK